MANRPMFDLLTTLKTFDHTKVTSLIGDPNIYIIGDNDPTTSEVDGEIVLSTQRSSAPINFGSKRHELYFIDGWIRYSSPDITKTDQTISEMMDEMTRLMNINNNSSAKIYDWQFEQTDYNANYQEGVIEFIISAKELYVTAIA